MLMQHSSPNAMTAMQRAAAIIAETGSLTGHMASICREFGVPTLMNLAGATNQLTPGQVVTVDALSGRVFDGEVPELLALRLSRRQPRADTPALVLLRRVAPYILPLHLVDPQSALFSPANCTSLHDVMRYAHELSYSEMFLLSDCLSENCAGGAASSRAYCASSMHTGFSRNRGRPRSITRAAYRACRPHRVPMNTASSASRSSISSASA